MSRKHFDTGKGKIWIVKSRSSGVHSTASVCSHTGHCRGPGKSQWRHPDSGAGAGELSHPDQDDNLTPRDPNTGRREQGGEGE